MAVVHTSLFDLLPGVVYLFVFLRRLRRQVWPSTLWARSKFVGISKKRSTGQDIADAGAHEIKTHHFRLAKQTSVRKFDILMFDK